MKLLPGLQTQRWLSVLTLGAIWFVVLVNLRGVKSAGVFSQVTTYAKLVPFGAIALIGSFYIDISHFSDFNPSGQSLISASAALAPLTMFAYLGLFATVPADDVENAATNNPASTILGISIAAAFLYVLGTAAVMAWCHASSWNRVALFSDAASLMWVGKSSFLAVILSSIGALNGWTLLMGQVPMVVAHESFFRRSWYSATEECQP